jgi:ribosomal protein S18 acetylase RimI-like enzyme
MNIVDIKANLRDERILAVIAHSQYKPTKETLTSLAEIYESDTSIFAYANDDNGLIGGVIVLKHLGNDEFEIVSIATNPACRNQGIASELISFAATNLECRVIRAETDDDAVGFYQKYGFSSISLGEKYPGTVRYLCTLNLHLTLLTSSFTFYNWTYIIEEKFKT